MSQDDFAHALLKAADDTDKGNSPAQVALLKRSYDFFKTAGMTDDAIKTVMALTSYQLRLIKALDK